MTPRRPRKDARAKRRPWQVSLEEWEKTRPVPLPEARRMLDPVPNMLAFPEGCAELARMVLKNYAEIPQAGRRQLALDIIENAIDYGFAPPREALAILKRELAVAPRSLATKAEFWRAAEIKRAEPQISIRELAKRVGVPWPTIGRWQRAPYWKIAVSSK
jgi:DNA-binding transcriptional regulator YiaG